MQRSHRIGLTARALSAPLVVVALLAGVGCQSFAPMSGIATKQREQKIVKRAANDPFPSPKDVGLGEQTKTL